MLSSCNGIMPSKEECALLVNLQNYYLLFDLHSILKTHTVVLKGKDIFCRAKTSGYNCDILKMIMMISKQDFHIGESNPLD